METFNTKRRTLNLASTGYLFPVRGWKPSHGCFFRQTISATGYLFPVRGWKPAQLHCWVPFVKALLTTGYLFPVRGWKREYPTEITQSYPYRIPFPRKGMETSATACWLSRIFATTGYLFPVRGWKPCCRWLRIFQFFLPDTFSP